MTTVLETTSVPGVRLLYRLAVLLAAVSGSFCLLFCAHLAIHYHGLLSPRSEIVAIVASEEALPTNDPPYRKPADDSFNRLPTDYQSFLALRNALSQDRQNETLKAQIRQLDLELRADYFKRRETIHQATFFLFASSILFFAAVRTASVLSRHIPQPNEKSPRSEKKSSWGFAALAAWLMLVAGLYLGLILAPPFPMEQMFRDKLVAEANIAAPTSRSDTQTTVTPTEKIILTEELLAKNWVSFRNFDGNGVGFSDNPPTRWDGKTGENIVWKTEVPMPGNSSPVIWNDKLFLTGADEETQKIFCFNINNGELLWTADVTRKEAKAGEVMEATGYAAPTAVTDGQHVYAMFANGELVAVDFRGKLVWRKSFGIPDNHYGFASSPALFFDRLIVQFDDGDKSESYSRLVAFNVNNGEVIWETRREDLHSTWASPTVKKIGDSYQIITCANPFVVAYNPDDGEEIWRCKCLHGDVGPSAASFGNVVLITNEGPQTTAIDATGTGDITATHILWTGVNATADTPSPLATDDYFLTLSSQGYLTGYDPKVVVIQNKRKRARYWELEVGDMTSFYSSPLRVGTYIYAFDMSKKNPRAFVIDLSKIAVAEDGSLTEESAAAMILSENPMPEPVVTSPAVLNDRLYIRGETTLFCIGSPKEPGT